ncbi:hypothetical protein SAMN02745126_00520 [Enhydrobacter aerosaccus]|uniref:Uncharacterized protein n=1 Tax=Enhydrobacter aerosaccus TaxID=225324 RepID=A0A1T4JVV7_9HYPH|nr:hypothetical protein [Enhydrobacter aerosaccus]SJZ34340.1 hypothetical protein SAMN02745126_00520 [Enhydrobacter aerosaccus]
MMMRSIKWAAGMSLVAATLTLATVAPAAAQGNLQAVPRAGVSFANTVTIRATIETVDTETRTVAFTTESGRLLESAVSDSVRNLDAIEDGTTADITFNEVVTLLNLRQKGPGSHEARRQATDPSASDIESGRFTMTVVGVNLAANQVSLVDPRGGQVRTLAATSIAKQDMLKKIKVGDVVIGIATPLMVTAITPVK